MKSRGYTREDLEKFKPVVFHPSGKLQWDPRFRPGVQGQDYGRVDKGGHYTGPTTGDLPVVTGRPGFPRRLSEETPR